MTGLNRKLAVTLAAVVAGGAAGLAGLSNVVEEERPATGPLQLPNSHGWATTAAVGDPFTDGMEVLRLTGDQDAVIEAVTMVGDDGLKLVGAKLAPPSRGIGAIQYHDAFPPKDDPDLGDVRLVDAVGGTVTPLGEDSAGWELLLGVEATREGYLVRTGVRIDYRVGDEQYTALLPANLAVCTSARHERRGRCPLPPG